MVLPFFSIRSKILLDQILHDRVEVDERFIDQGKGGLVDEGLRKHQFLPGAPGEVLAEHVLLVPELEKIEPPVRLCLKIGDLPNRTHKGEIFHRGEETRRRFLLGNNPDAVPHTDRVFSHIQPENCRRAAGRTYLPGQHLDHRCLAGPVRTEETEKCPLIHAERDVVNCRYIAIHLG